MPLYRSTTKTRLCLDKVPNSNRMYQCEPMGSLAPNGLPGDTIDIAQEHLELPGIAAAIAQKVLVPANAPSQADVKKANQSSADDGAAKAKADADAKAAADKAAADAKAKADADAKAAADAKAKADAEAKAAAPAEKKGK